MLALALILAAAPDAGPARPRDEVLAVVQRQVAAWNRGDLEAFCAVYADDAVFLSPSGVTRGRAEVLARYRKRYPDQQAMGQLTLEPLDVRETAEGVSVAATWTLASPDKPKASGHTVIVFVRWRGAWRIVHDASM